MTWIDIQDAAPKSVDALTQRLVGMMATLGEMAEGESEPVEAVMRYQATIMLGQALDTGEVMLASGVIAAPDDDSER